MKRATSSAVLALGATVATVGGVIAYSRWRRRDLLNHNSPSSPSSPSSSSSSTPDPFAAFNRLPPAPNPFASPAPARNARRRGATWRSPLGPDRRWAQWMRDLYGRNGVYMIRSVSTHQVLYIGESHTGRLFYTLTRHLWNWNGEGAGPSYSPQFVEVAVELHSDPDEAIERQFELIRKLDPRDNQQDGHSLLDEVPF
jgi:hypothetical protein